MRYTAVYVQPRSTAHASVGGSAWRHYGGVQRSSTEKDRVREKEELEERWRDNVRKGRGTESPDIGDILRGMRAPSTY